ncbi:MAG: ABC transporter substrate-binding protein [Clostridia bacterium]|nr:ABC transporter substrate-binding protein [Clostridia bacterium]
MKKFITLLLAAAMSAGCMMSMTGCGNNNTEQEGNNAPSGDDKTVYIGVYEPASGDNGAGGKQETLGVQYANSQVNTVDINGEEYNVQLVVVDNESSNDKAPSAAQELVSKGASVVLGSYGSSVSIAASDIFQKGGVPAIGITCTNPQVTEGNTHYFRICFLDPFQGTVLANYAKNLGATKAYCLAKLGDDYSGGLVHYFEEAFKKAGGEVVSETFQEGNSDFTSYITNAKNAGAQVFFAPVSTEAAALIIEQASSQDIGMPLMAGDTWDSNVILNAAKDKNIEILVTTFYQEGGNPEFDAGIKEWVNADSKRIANNGGDDKIAAVTAMGYDAYFVALEAIKAAGSTDRAKINEALWDVNYNGVCGNVTFNDTGDANRDTAYVKKVNTQTGMWDFVAEQGVE